MPWVLLLVAAAPQPQPQPDLVDVAQIDDRFTFDIRYATEDNFFGKKVYPVPRCLLRREVAEMVAKAQAWLDTNAKGHTLLFKDCYRPNHVQHVLWDAVKGTKKSGYVANPNTKTGSIHSYGAAVDLTLAAPDGKEVDMGTPYDHLGKLAEPRHEQRFLAEGKLTKAQIDQRRRLRDAMTKGGGFVIIRNEWWHFNAASSKQIRKRYERLDVPLTAIVQPWRATERH